MDTIEVFGRIFQKDEWMDIFLDVQPEATEEDFESAWAEFVRQRQARMAN